MQIFIKGTLRLQYGRNLGVLYFSNLYHKKKEKEKKTIKIY